MKYASLDIIVEHGKTMEALREKIIGIFFGEQPPDTKFRLIEEAFEQAKKDMDEDYYSRERELTKRVNELSDERTRLMTVNARHVEKIGELENSIETAVGANRSIAQDMDGIVKRANGAADEIVALRAAMLTQEKMIDELKNEIETKNHEMASLRSKMLDAQHSEENLLKHLNENHRKSLAEKDKDSETAEVTEYLKVVNASLQTALDESFEDKRRLEKMLAAAEDQFEKSHTQLKEANTKLNDEANKRHILERDLTIFKESERELRTSYGEMRASLIRANSERDKVVAMHNAGLEDLHAVRNVISGIITRSNK